MTVDGIRSRILSLSQTMKVLYDDVTDLFSIQTPSDDSNTFYCYVNTTFNDDWIIFERREFQRLDLNFQG